MGTMGMPNRSSAPLVVALLAGALLWPALVVAQTASPESRPRGSGAGVLAGTIIDARSGDPVAGATVVLQPETAGAFPGAASGSAFAATGRTTTSDSVGGYRFEKLPPGVYRLYVSRVSYRPYSIAIEMRGEAAAVSIGLGAHPIALEPVRGRGSDGTPFRVLAAGPDMDGARLLAVELRRRRFLTTDVRELTDADVAEAVTLGEPDVFRALQRLAGVTGRSDYSAELWTRGAPWSHTRVYFDGVPIFNPLHALGVLSGIGSSAAGALWFHPGVRSAGMGEGAAGVVDLRSRRGGGSGELNLQGDLSLMSAGVALDQRVLDGNAGWLLTGRRTYMDWLADLTSRATGSDADFPYGFAEVTGHLDARLGEHTGVDVSWLWEEDHLSRDAIPPVEDEPGTGPLRTEWGNALVQATLSSRWGGLNVRHGLASSRHTGDVASGDPEFSGPLRLSRSRVDYAGVSGSLWPDAATVAGPEWTVGYGLERHAVRYAGPVPLPVPTLETASGRPQSGALPDSLMTNWSGSLPMAVLWGERSWAPDDRLSVRAGLRAEASERLRDAGLVRLAPRATVRFAATPETSLSAGYGRVFQYTQALAPGGVHVASLVSSDAWLLAGPHVPPIRSDMVTAGIEAWLEPGRVVTLNGFGRRSTGVALPDPQPGPILDRPEVITGENLAYGVEVSVRQLSGPVTGSAAYTLSRSRMTAGGLEFPATADRTHVLDATLMVRTLPSLRIGAAFTGATGVPFTRTIAASEDCDVAAGCDPETLPWAGAPNAERAPTFASLDLLVDWTIRRGRTEVGIYGQLRNALGRENATIYTGGGPGCVPGDCQDGGLHNAYERGIPRLPVIGLRVRR